MPVAPPSTALQNSQLSVLTARAGIGRAGMLRANFTVRDWEVDSDHKTIIWKRAKQTDGNPAVPLDTWETERE